MPGAAAVHLHAVGFAVAVALLGASGCRPRSAHEKERAAAARTKPPVPACESFDRAAAACLAGGGGGLAPRERSQLETQRAQFRQIVAAASSEAARSALSRSCAVSERTLSGKCAPLAGRR